jgi:hypothetical protein
MSVDELEVVAEYHVSPSLVIQYLEGKHMVFIDPITKTNFVILAKEMPLLKTLLWQICTYEGAN